MVSCRYSRIKLDDGVLGAELFQHLGAGGVPRLGLFHRGQPQPLKEDPPQLLGGIDVKLLPRLGIDLPLEHLDAGLQGLAEVGQGRLVHQHPGLLHLRQHGAEGALNLLIHLGQAELCHLLGQAAVQGGSRQTWWARACPAFWALSSLFQALAPR